MQEAFLHFIWKYQYFDKRELITTSGDQIEVFDQGFLQTDAGPDFSQCKIRIGDILWSGHVEVHIKSGAWLAHHHDEDQAYDNVVLHVVWENDKVIERSDSSIIPVLELKDRVDNDLLYRYKKLINQPHQIPCQDQFQSVNDITKIGMSDKALLNRLERKADEVLTIHDNAEGSWEEVAYRLLCRNFGFKINNDAFEMLSKALPLKYIHKHSNSLVQVEALLLGQAGFLDEVEADEYYLRLKQEYSFLSKKYKLEENKLSKHQWKFLRLRPANFPTLRIAQLAVVLSNLKNVFSAFINSTSLTELNEQFEIVTSEYWNTHYHFGKKSEKLIKKLGKSSTDNLIINTVVPILAAYGKLHDDQKRLDRAIEFLQQIKPESNRIIKQWKLLDLPIKTAFDSQSSIELYNEYCIKKKCLSCNIGVKLLTDAEV